MNRDKIRKIVRQAYPSKKIVQTDADQKYAADPNADDVDVGSLSPGTWKKFGTVPKPDPTRAQASNADREARFRPRTLTGAGPARTRSSTDLPDSAQSGKLALERLAPQDASADTEDTLDVLVDEDDGVIGESDSGPDED